MAAFRQLWLFFRGMFRGWDRALALALRSGTRLVGRLVRVVWAWGRARSWRYLAQGLPALAATAAVIVLLVRWLTLPTHVIEARYQERAAATTKAKDFAMARVCYERLAVMGKDRPDNLYELAIALGAQGEPERAFEIMDQLAPVDRTGHGPAHLWLALYYWKGLGDPRYRTKVEAHLTRALQAGLQDPDAAHGLLGELYAQTGKPELAEPHLERAVKSRLHIRLRYAQVLAAQGKKARAADEAKLAINFFKTHSQADATDHVSRIGWAESVVFLEDFPQALAILAEGLHLTGEPAYRTTMANVVATWHFFIVRTQPDDVTLQWNLLEKGLQLDNTNARLLDRLVKLMGKGATDADKARAVMNKVLVTGEATGTTHFLLGMDAWQQGDAAKAKIHWERALEMSPNLPMVANNLAWLLAHAKNPDLPRALELANRVIENQPLDPSYRDTRARVYMKMARWRDALPDLEWLLAHYPGFPRVHAALAEVYGQLGMQDLAGEHRRAQEASEKKRAKN